MAIKLFYNLLKLTKPTIMMLVIFTGAVALVVDGYWREHPGNALLILLTLFLTGGCANALNQYFERNIDAQMSRTQKRRPLPQGQIPPALALIFSVSIGLIGTLLLAFYFNILSAAIALSTIFFYSLFYTLFLKPNTPQNIVIGGAAGAMGPIIAIAAARGTITLDAMVMFLIVFFWTPPHFWALALFCVDDYRKVNLPMLPVIKGESHTINQMLIYTFVMVGVSLLLLLKTMGWIYAITSILLGAMFMRHMLGLKRDPSEARKRGVFFFSINYLFLLFGSMIADFFLHTI